MNFNSIINNLNDISKQLFQTVEDEVYKTLDKITSIKVDILNEEPLKQLFNQSSENGIILIANSLILFFITYYIFTQLISLLNGDKSENIYLFIFKVIIITLLINNSYFICRTILDLNEKLEDIVSWYGKDVAGKEVSFSNLKQRITNIQDFLNTDLISLDGIIKGVISFGSITILINFSIRYVLIIILIFLFPIAISICLSKNTIPMFFNYLKTLITLLLMGSIVKIIMILPMVYKDIDSTMYKIILVGSIYVIYKLNFYVKEMFMNINLNKTRRSLFE